MLFVLLVSLVSASLSWLITSHVGYAPFLGHNTAQVDALLQSIGFIVFVRHHHCRNHPSCRRRRRRRHVSFRVGRFLPSYVSVSTVASVVVVVVRPSGVP